MSTHAARTRAGRDRPSLYQEITDKAIAEPEASRVPWVQPWGDAAAKASLAMPKNAATQRQYSGINVLILWDAVIERGFSTQNWLTFRQALGLGGNVRKGEHGTTVVYADRFAHGPRTLAFGMLDVDGPIARNVSDAALMLDAMTGQHPQSVPEFHCPEAGTAHPTDRLPPPGSRPSK
jgi:antirestriction protein ArdC